EVDVGAVGAGSEREGGLVGRGDAVQVIGRPITARQGAGDDLHRVGAGRQTAEGVVAVAGGDGGGDGEAVAVEQLDGDVVEAGLAGVLDAVAVDVDPDPVAHGAEGAAVVQVDVDVALAGGLEAGAGGRLMGHRPQEPAGAAEVDVLAVGTVADLERRAGVVDGDHG